MKYVYEAKVIAAAEHTVAGTEHWAGLASLSTEGVFTTALELKNKAGIYVCKPGTYTGENVFQVMFNSIKDQGGVIKTIQGNWTYGDNLAEFNRLITSGLTETKAALKTFTGRQAEKLGYKNASVDFSQSIRRQDGTFEKVVVNFTE